MENINKEIKIFIVEDDLIFTSILIDILDRIAEEYKEKNIDVTYKAFYSAKEASFELRRNPDIVLLDYYIMDDSLQPLTANEFIANAISTEAKVDIIVISGQEDEKLIEEIKAKGIKTYLGKDPTSLTRLSPTIMKIIDTKLNFIN